MAESFQIHPIQRFAGPSQPLKRPKEFTCFSYDDTHTYRQDDSSVRYYYPPQPGVDLSRGFDSFVKHDDSADEHLVSLLRAIQHHESAEDKRVNVQVVTWRGMMTKILAVPYETRDGFEMNATRHQASDTSHDCIFIEENHPYKQATRNRPPPSKPRRGPPPEVMTYWGYKFETLSTLATPWGEASRETIEGRGDEVVNNNAQYCSVVRTGIGSTTLCLGGEVDAIWDSKPTEPGTPINWVELKTSQELQSPQDHAFFAAKLMRFWIQSFLLGVPRIVVGFRSRDGILQRVEELDTARIPEDVAARPNPPWNGHLCINFAAAFLEWLRTKIDGEGVWRIKREPGGSDIQVFKVEDSGHGRILTPEFIAWRANCT